MRTSRLLQIYYNLKQAQDIATYTFSKQYGINSDKTLKQTKIKAAVAFVSQNGLIFAGKNTLACYKYYLLILFLSSIVKNVPSQESSSTQRLSASSTLFTSSPF